MSALGPFAPNSYAVGDCRDLLRQLPDGCIDCAVTSPPYWGLRDYGIEPGVWGGRADCIHRLGAEMRLHKGGPHGDGVMLGGIRAVVDAQAAVKDIRAGQFCADCGAWRGCLGLEPDYRMYVEHMVEVFREVNRVLKSDGTLWLNLGDCYATGAGAVGNCPGGGTQGERWRGYRGERWRGYRGERLANGRGDQSADGRVKTQGYRGTRDGSPKHSDGIGPMTQPNRLPQPGLKPKDLVGIPWRVAFALQGDGWYLRSEIIWHKPNPMPESVTDRPTKAHEQVFLLSKSERYHYDADAISEAATCGATRNKRSVWTISTEPTPDAHFATFPRKLIEPCILAGCPAGGTVLDPFGGSGTVGRVAEDIGRKWLLFDLNPEYAKIAKRKTAQIGLLGSCGGTA